MLVELSISNYAVIDRLKVTLGPGFNVLTGETGAGKSIILDAMGLLLGDRADPGAVRAGTDQAYVEGIFEIGPDTAAVLSELLDLDVGSDGLILAREVNASGRSVCRVNGRAFPQRKLAEIGNLLVDIHGQSEHLSLLRPSEHVDLLDRYAGLTELRSRYAGIVRTLTRTRKEMQALEQENADAAGRKDLLAFQAQEISAAGLSPGEEAALAGERTLRVNALRIHELVGLAQAALDSDEVGEPGAVELIGRAVQSLVALEKIDASMGSARQTAETAALQLEELVRDLRDFAEGVEYDQQRLAEIEERLNLISSLKRKYGDSVEEVLEFETRANAELARLNSHGTSVAHLEAEIRVLRQQAAELAGQLSAARRSSAARLTAAVEEQLGGLGMEGARLGVWFGLAGDPEGLELGEAVPLGCTVASGAEVAGEPVEGPLKFDLTGVDRLEFVISPNPGEPLRPLATIASGGETSRLMLAIKGVLSQADAVPILVFDEIDAGIGGRVGEAVGRRLWELGRQHQVVAVTHLPQIAAFGDRHLSVKKRVEGGRTTTEVLLVAGEGRVAELTQMLGSDTAATRQKAAELLTEIGRAVASQGGV
ncbi:MAG TPA: DNA repair protein RecN [Actinomycetota bacterium]|nr:DNA repair protein RecN [Actinomycetota bacterium]